MFTNKLRKHYVGRFAPSPTGSLHFGSLLAALASYLEAKTNHGKWLVRMEDLDKPREVAGAASHILQTLENYGFEWDNEVIYQNTIYQSKRTEAYEQALAELIKQNMVYPCTCSRKEILDFAIRGIDGLIYPGTCLRTPASSNKPAAWRVKVNATPITYKDAIQGEQTQNLALDIGDFILKRADSLFAYQLAVAVDDAFQGITHIVRGADLIDSTPRQIYLQRLLAFSTPHYAHIPVATNLAGEKLSKQTLAEPIADQNPTAMLFKTLVFLEQSPEKSLANASLHTVWQWAFEHWDMQKIKAGKAKTYS